MSNFEARLRERDEDRKAAAEKRRVHREEGQRVEESSGYVAQQFAQKKTGKRINPITSCIVIN